MIAGWPEIVPAMEISSLSQHWATSNDHHVEVTPVGCIAIQKSIFNTALLVGQTICVYIYIYIYIYIYTYIYMCSISQYINHYN